MTRFAFAVVLVVLVVPVVYFEPISYVRALFRFWPWVAYAAAGWIASLVYVMRRVQELRLKAPGARTQVRAAQ